jgi:hypothetical protein
MRTCANCPNVIPWAAIIDGKQRNLGSRKLCLECSPFARDTYRRAKRKGDGDQVVCACGRKFAYRHSSGHSYERCNSCIVNSRRLTRKKELVRLKGGACLRCGYSKSLRSLCFHHRDPAQKRFDLNVRSFMRAMRELIAEAEKCDLLCANCHGEAHDEIDLPSRSLIRLKHSPDKTGSNGSNPFVTSFTPVPCMKKVAWPDDSELAVLLASTPATTVAKQLGISSVAIAKRCQKRGIPTRPRGYWMKI